VVRQQRVLELGEKANRRRHVFVGTRRVGQVEQLTLSLIPEGDELVPEPLEYFPQSAQPRPRLRVPRRRWSEGGEIAQHERVERHGLGGELRAQPTLRETEVRVAGEPPGGVRGVG